MKQFLDDVLGSPAMWAIIIAILAVVLFLSFGCAGSQKPGEPVTPPPTPTVVTDPPSIVLHAEGCKLYRGGWEEKDLDRDVNGELVMRCDAFKSGRALCELEPTSSPALKTYSGTWQKDGDTVRVDATCDAMKDLKLLAVCEGQDSCSEVRLWNEANKVGILCKNEPEAPSPTSGQVDM